MVTATDGLLDLEQVAYGQVDRLSQLLSSTKGEGSEQSGCLTYER